MNIQTTLNIGDIIYQINDKDFTIDKILIRSIEVYVRNPPDAGHGENESIETSIMYNGRASSMGYDFMLREENLKDIFMNYEDAIVELEKRAREHIANLRKANEPVAKNS